MDKSVILKINYEISEIYILVDKSDVLISLCKNKEPDFIEITAIGGILQSFYNGIENIFVLIAKSLNFDFKTSPQWHRALIDFMFAQPNFLQQKLRLRLTEYMGFRHFYRHTYGYTVKWEKCSHLFLEMKDFWNIIKKAFNDYLESNKTGDPKAAL